MGHDIMKTGLQQNGTQTYFWDATVKKMGHILIFGTPSAKMGHEMGRDGPKWDTNGTQSNPLEPLSDVETSTGSEAEGNTGAGKTVLYIVINKLSPF